MNMIDGTSALAPDREPMSLEDETMDGEIQVLLTEIQRRLTVIESKINCSAHAVSIQDLREEMKTFKQQRVAQILMFVGWGITIALAIWKIGR